MRRIIAGLAALTVAAAAQGMTGDLTPERAAAYFAEFAKACAQSNAKQLWGVEIFGPVLLVDPATRRIIANEPDKEGLLTETDGVYVGVLPPDKVMVNAPVDLGGVRWAMVIDQYLADNPIGRVATIAHESFHRVQFALGLMAIGRENNHLDTLEGRYWLQLEWNALQAAADTAGQARRAAIQDALTFRAARRAKASDAAERENAVEIREGLAQYTGARVAGLTLRQVVERVNDRRERFKALTRTFGYNSGPLYGYLLDAALGDAWRKQVTKTTDLGAMLANALHIAPQIDQADERARRYGGESLRAAEETRERARLEQLAAWKTSLIDGPVLIVDLSRVSTSSMVGTAVHPFDENRIVYTIRKIIADWGALVVDGGAILENSETNQGRLSLRHAASDHLSGEGWTLELREGWMVVPADRPGDFIVRPAP